MAEELARHELLRDGAGVNRNERTLAAAAAVVEAARHELFAGARFADDEHRCACRCDSLDASEDFAHPRRPADHPLEHRGARRQVLVVADLAHVVGVQELLQERDEPHRVDRLLQVVARAELQRLDRACHRALAGDQHHRRRRLELAQLPDEIDPARTWQVQVGDDHVDRVPAKHLQRVLGRLGRHHLHAERRQHGAQQRYLVRLVVHEQNAARLSAAVAVGVFSHPSSLSSTFVCQIFTGLSVHTIPHRYGARSGPSAWKRYSRVLRPGTVRPIA